MQNGYRSIEKCINNTSLCNDIFHLFYLILIMIGGAPPSPSPPPNLYWRTEVLLYKFGGYMLHGLPSGSPHNMYLMAPPTYAIANDGAHQPITCAGREAIS